MNRCLVQTGALLAEKISLNRAEARHLQAVLRVRPGEEVELFDGAGLTRRVIVASATRDGLQFTPSEPPQKHAKLPISVTLFASVIKRMDWTIEKATELGADRIVPVVTERSVVRINKAEGFAKVERWMRIAEESVRQCDGAWLPVILPPATFRESLALVKACVPTFVAALSPAACPMREALAEHPPEDLAGFYVGPEGDFTPGELSELLAAGAIPVRLGPRVLRAETACLYGLSVFSAANG